MEDEINRISGTHDGDEKYALHSRDETASKTRVVGRIILKLILRNRM
jgi:hypothetical protein